MSYKISEKMNGNLATITCSVCEEDKVLSNFAIKYRLYDDLKPICQSCLEVKQKEKDKITIRERYKKKKEEDPYIMWAIGTINNHKRKGYQVDLTVKELADTARHVTRCMLCGCTLV